MTSFIRPSISAMKGYVPGEQPRLAEFIKLNTNESPYPPSPRVVEAIREVLQSEHLLRKYPDPIGTAFRQTAANVLNVEPDAIIPGNGSDDILTILTRAFVPEGGKIVFPTPSYVLYKTLAEIQNAGYQTVPFISNWQLPSPWPLPEANLTFVPNPNSPTGTVLSLEELRRLAGEINGPLVIDEAYVDFAKSSALELHRLPNVLITRTMSKSYALAGIRFGFGIANPDLIRQLMKVKDSYNCDVLSLAAATAAIEDQEYLQTIRTKILTTRNRLEKQMAEFGFQVTPSQANFVWCQHPQKPVQPIYEALKERKILVRYMQYEGFGEGLRISVGTDEEMDRFFDELRKLL